MDTIVRRVPDPGHRTFAVRVPVMVICDPLLSARAVAEYCALAALDGARIDQPQSLRAQLDLENAGWLIVVREASRRVLVLLNTRNMTPTDAVRLAYPEGTPEAMHQGTLQAIGSPQASPEADSESEWDHAARIGLDAIVRADPLYPFRGPVHTDPVGSERLGAVD